MIVEKVLVILCADLNVFFTGLGAEQPWKKSIITFKVTPNCHQEGHNCMSIELNAHVSIACDKILLHRIVWM